MTNNKEELRSKVLVALDQLRPFLHADGGDMELIDITDDAIVQVRYWDLVAIARCLK